MLLYQKLLKWGEDLLKKVNSTVAVILVVILVSVILVLLTPHILTLFAYLSSDLMKENLFRFIDSIGAMGIPVLIALQALQIVVAFLPGGIVEVAGGMIYGPLLGSVISLVGIFTGTVIAFWLAKHLGRPFIKHMVNEDSFDRYLRLCNNKHFEQLILFLFFLPGVPKDILIYVIGSGTKSLRLGVMASIIRIPSILISVYVGTLFGQGQFANSVRLYIMFFIIGGIGLFINKIILNRLDKK